MLPGRVTHRMTLSVASTPSSTRLSAVAPVTSAARVVTVASRRGKIHAPSAAAGPCSGVGAGVMGEGYRSRWAPTQLPHLPA